MSTESPADAQRRQLLSELERHRRRLDEVLSPGPVPARLARIGGGGFPRSHTMRLLLSEPLLLAGFSAIAMRLVGPRLMRLLPLTGAVAKAVYAVLRPLSGTSHQLQGAGNGPGPAAAETAGGKPPHGHEAKDDPHRSC